MEQVTNFAGAESLSAVAAGIMSFSHNHKISSLTINDLLNNFRGYDWGWNGPGVITRSLQKYCGDCKVNIMYIHTFNYKIQYFRSVFWFLI